MTTTPPPRTGLDRFFDTLRSTGVRRDGDRWVAGVATGVAERTGIAVQLVRAAFIIAFFALGVGVIAYLTLWLVTPGRDDELPLELALREGDAKSIVLLVLVTIGLLGGGGWSDAFAASDGIPAVGTLLWTLAIIGAVVWLVRRSRRQVPPGPMPDAWSTPAPPPGPRAGQPSPTATQPVAPPPAPGFARTTATAPMDRTDVLAPANAPTAVLPGPAPASATSTPNVPQTAPATADPTTPPLPPEAHRAGYTGWTAPEPVRYREPRPRPLRRRGPGFLVLLATLGLMALAGGGVALARRGSEWSLSTVPLALAAALLVGGLVTVVLGVMGRRSGLIGVVSALLLVPTVALSLAPSATWVHGPAGQVGWTPTTGQELTLSGGQGLLHLTRLPREGRTALTVHAGVGSVVVYVPPGTTVHLHATTRLGSISTSTEAARLLTDGPDDAILATDGKGDHVLGAGKDISVTRVYGAGTRHVDLDVEVGVGEVVVRKEA